jgi:hypothetical protein
MSGKRPVRLSTAAVAACILTAGLTAPPAHASGWGTRHDGPFAGQAQCDTQSTAANSPPWIYTFPCSYFAGDPDSRNRGAGWYYYVMYDNS